MQDEAALSIPGFWGPRTVEYIVRIHEGLLPGLIEIVKEYVLQYALLMEQSMSEACPVPSIPPLLHECSAPLCVLDYQDACVDNSPLPSSCGLISYM